MTEGRPLAEDIGEALVGDVDPERLEGFRFAQRILPIFRLVRLHAADFDNLAPANALARSAQNAAFGATLDGASSEAAG